jgi:glycosyltransferase involved in cell wall biosynthesis
MNVSVPLGPIIPDIGGRARPLRVLHVVQQLKSGGAETFVRGLTAGLRQGGVDASILSVYADGLSEPERAALGVPVRSLERRGRGDVAGFYPRLVGAVRAAQPDILHAHLHAGKYAGRIAALVAGVPAIVFTEHGDEAGGWLREAVNRVLHPRTTAFVVFSEAQRRAFALRERVSLERVVVIPNGVARPPEADRATLRAELRLTPEAFAYFVPARLTAQKNPSLALRSFALAFPRDESARLIFAGTGPLEASLRAEASELGVAGRVTFLGFRDDVPRLMRGMDAFVMASVWERMPLALGEAMRAGLPVVTTPWEGSDAFVTDGITAVVAEDATPAAFAQALVSVRVPGAGAALADRARELADRTFALEASVEAHTALYASLAASTGRPSTGSG